MPCFPEETHPDVVYMETQTSALYLEAPAERQWYSLVFDHLRAQALAPAQSKGLITQAMKDL